MKDISQFPVMKTQCATCLFRTDEKGKYRDTELLARLQVQCLSEASQICHHPNLEDKKTTHLCRGAGDYQLEIFHRIGILNEPTDVSWSEKTIK